MPSIKRKENNKNLGGITPANLHLDSSLKHFGPFNKVSENIQKDPTDEAARQHDIAYGKLGFQAYFRHNEADEKFINAIKNDKRPIVQAGRKYFQFKKGLSKTLGINMPRRSPYSNRFRQLPSQRRKEAYPTPPPSPSQPLSLPGGSMSTESTGTAALGATSIGNPGSGSALQSDSHGMEVIPGHQPDDMGTNKTLRSSNTFRVFYETKPAWSIVTAATRNACESGPNVDYNQNNVIDASNRVAEINTDWCYLPNNKLDLYVTPAQMSKFIMGVQ